jgi:hypothetical protein
MLVFSGAVATLRVKGDARGSGGRTGTAMPEGAKDRTRRIAVQCGPHFRIFFIALVLHTLLRKPAGSPKNKTKTEDLVSAPQGSAAKKCKEAEQKLQGGRAKTETWPSKRIWRSRTPT